MPDIIKFADIKKILEPVQATLALVPASETKLYQPGVSLHNFLVGAEKMSGFYAIGLFKQALGGADQGFWLKAQEANQDALKLLAITVKGLVDQIGEQAKQTGKYPTLVGFCEGASKQLGAMGPTLPKNNGPANGSNPDGPNWV